MIHCWKRRPPVGGGGGGANHAYMPMRGTSRSGWYLRRGTSLKGLLAVVTIKLASEARVVTGRTTIQTQNHSFRVVEYRSHCELKFIKLSVKQGQLDTLCTLFNIPPTVTMRALRPNDLRNDTQEGTNKIPFPTIAFECG